MEIKINNQIKTLDADCLVLTDVINACDFPDKGIAVAVNNTVIRRAKWNDTVVGNGDCLTVIQAVCGG